MPSHIKAVIFDLFGTLTNGQANPEDRIVKAFGLDTSEDYSRFVEQVVCASVHKSKEEYIAILMERLRIKDTPNNVEILKNIFVEDLRGEVIRPEAVGVLETLAGRGMKLGLISDLPNEDYDLPRRQGFKHLFGVTTYSYETGVLKPDPRPFQRTLAGLGTTPQETIMVGNSLRSDIEPAKQIGMFAILFDVYNKYPQYSPKISDLRSVYGFLQDTS